MQKISIIPIDGGWLLNASGLSEPIVFRSGAKAERTARLMGERLARAGDGAQLDIFMRDGARAGRVEFPPAA